MRKASFARVLELAQADPRVILAASDIGAETVSEFRKRVPRQLLMEGISEGHLVGMAAGLAKEGNVVFINTIASFLTQRCLEQIAINLCLEGVNVKLLAQGGGLVYGSQGPTHHAIGDVALMRALPDLVVIVPCDTEQVKNAVDFAYRHPGPVYIRLAKGSAPVLTRDQPAAIDRPTVFRDFKDLLFVATGPMTQVALEASQRLPGSGVVGVPMLKPFCHRELGRLVERAKVVVTLEEHSEIGGLSSCVCETIVTHCPAKPAFLNLSLKDEFVRSYGTQEELLHAYGLDAQGVYEAVRKFLSR